LRPRRLPVLPGGAAGARRHRLHPGARPVAPAHQDPRAGDCLGHRRRPPRTHHGGAVDMAAISLSEAGPFTEEQRALARTVRDVVTKRADSTAVRAAAESEAGYDVALWSLLCVQIGVAALAVPEEYDGIGAGYIE